MIKEVLFTKASGAGNDFVILDNREDVLPADKSELSRSLCSRYFGVGADGLLLLERSSRAHFTMKYYNADGSYGGMCGNGGRCIARFAFANEIAPGEMSFESVGFIYHAEILCDVVRLRMRDPDDLRMDVEVHIAQELHRGFFINTGSPHFVEFVEDIEHVEVDRVGRSIRHDPLFSPEGANANFVQVIGNDSIRLRTYERGVEAETLACGTGSVAAGIISHLFRKTALPVTIQVRSGELLKVDAVSRGHAITSPTLEGSAKILFTGRLLYDDIANEIVDLADSDKQQT